MASKTYILENIKQNLRPAVDMPDLDRISPTNYEDKLGKFLEMVESVGGHTYILQEGEDLNELIHKLYPDAEIVASSLPYIKSDKNPDQVSDAAELADVDLGVLEGELAVAENGCVWVPQTMKERAIMFISQSLVLLVDRARIVNNMHEAYAMLGQYEYGCFISGPSKTADIAQALVMGAQAARDVTVIVI